ncbi:SDR family oxidoreductase [Bacillus ginsengihumi]|uniref:SDR family oxidoreductase n=1 Tax=Heyndrickxia ginsengihumi TaxID=363870 RepID=A0A6M0PAA6_9BACI|nr:SDR family oxidoreductase [Heyndrickxia ginsengihumi]
MFRITTLVVGSSGQLASEYINKCNYETIIGVDISNSSQIKNSKFHYLPVNVTKEEEIHKLVTFLEENSIILNKILFCVGVNKLHNFFSSTIEDFEETISVNFISVYKILKNIYNSLSEKTSIVLVASQNGVVGHIDRIDYGPSKAALIHLVKNLSLDFAEYSSKDIKVNAISPGYIVNSKNHDFFNTSKGKKLISKIPYRKLVTNTDVINTIDFLFSEKSNAIRGQNIVVDYGFTIQ